jgi:glutamyl-tRNA reductase
MIVGEFEILGQVRHALEEAERAGTVQSPLLNLFRQALRVGRRAREETAISRNAASVSSAGVELARQFFGDLTRCKVLVISAGEAGKLTARALVKTGIAEMTVTSRTYERAVALASRLGGRAIPFHHLKQALSEADIVISCSGSPHFILEPPAIEEAMRSRPERPLFLIDIAVPRDIDPEVKKVSNVLLHDIDDLRMVSEANVREREKEVEKVTALIEAEVTKFMEWWDSLKVVPTITALVNKCESIRQRELAKFISRRSHLSEEDRNQMEILTRSIIKKILHDPILRLKKHGADGKYDQAVRELFKLDEEV